jgi:integrase
MPSRKAHGTHYQYVTRSGAKRWRAQANDSKRTSKSFKTKNEAQSWLAEFNRQAKKIVTNPLQTTFEEYAQEWLSALTLANSTIQGYDKNLRNHVLPTLGDKPLESITAKDIESLYQTLRSKGRKDSKDFGGALSENTINKVHQNLRKILDLAVEDGLILSNPAKQKRIVKPPSPAKIRAQKQEVQTLSAEQLVLFLEFNEQQEDDLNLLWRLIIETGLRRGEAIALQWSDLDVTNSRLSIRRAADPSVSRGVKRTKTNRDRNLELDPQLVSVLLEYKKTRGVLGPAYVSANAYIFGTLNNELRVPNDVGARFSRAVKKAVVGITKAELPHFTLKTLRHTHATLMLANGSNPKIVQERLGHSTITVTMDTYSHVTPTVQREAVELLTSVLNKAKEQNK